MVEPFVVRPRSAPVAGRSPSSASGSETARSAPGGPRPEPIDGSARRSPAPSAPARRSVPRHPALEPLAAHLVDPDVTDLFINGSDGLFVDRGDGPEHVRGWHADEEGVRALAVGLVSAGGRHVDDAAPCVDVRLEGGIRVHAVLPPISTSGTLISVRVPRSAEPSLDELEHLGALPPGARAWLEALVAERQNVLISGAAGTGKTTLLSAMLAAAPSTDRIVTIEDVAELRIAHPHHIALEARQPNLEGAGGIGLARLVREALRMRPDRIVVGECRGEEVRELLSALNTGHDGGAGTLHASGLDDVPARLEALGALAGLDDRALARQAVSAIGWVLHLHRDASGRRRLADAGRLALHGGALAVERSTPWVC